MKMQIVGLFLLAVPVVTKYIISRQSKDWDYFVFAQQWPQSVCLWDNILLNSYSHSCKIPEIVNTWVVHGLWPSKRGLPSPGPYYCDRKKFDPSKIKPIEQMLEQYWPNLFTDEPLTSFWKHEWLKHGTCAETLPATAGEYRYFTMGLQLNSKFNLTSYLNKCGYFPSDIKAYKVSDLYDCIHHILNGKPYLECVSDKTQDKSYIGQIEVCTDKAFKVIDCEHTNLSFDPLVLYFQRHNNGHSGQLRPCQMDEEVYWPEIRHTT